MTHLAGSSRLRRHFGDGHDHSHAFDQATRAGVNGQPPPFAVGVGGPVGSGKTALIEALIPRMIERGHSPLVITNDIFTQLDAEHVRATLAGILPPDRVVGVETGSCPHTAVRDDPTMNLAAMDELTARFPDADLIFLESGGDNLTLTFSPSLVEIFLFVIDVAEGDKIPRKKGPGIANSDLLVINKVDLAPYVRANLNVMRAGAEDARGAAPYAMTNCLTGDGLDQVIDFIEHAKAHYLNSLHSHTQYPAPDPDLVPETATAGVIAAR